MNIKEIIVCLIVDYMGLKALHLFRNAAQNVGFLDDY